MSIPATIAITDNAVKRIKQLQQIDNDDQLMLRLSVNGGGCSGFQYHFEFTKTIAQDDLIIEKDNVKVIIDPTSINFVKGCTLDFIEELSESYFHIQNPLATAKCGCGNSFAV